MDSNSSLMSIPYSVPDRLIMILINCKQMGMGKNVIPTFSKISHQFGIISMADDDQYKGN